MLPDDLRVFLAVIRKNGFNHAAQELGYSPAYISKRVSILEATLGARLLHRTTRRVALTVDGAGVRVWAARFLGDMDDFISELTDARQQLRGSLHICSSFGFGRNHVAPAITLLSRRCPKPEIRLDVFDRVGDIVNEGFDLEIQEGDDLPDQLMGKKLVSNHRVLCATPDYLERRGIPENLDDLAKHDCLVLKERNYAVGIWNLTKEGVEESVRVSGPLSSNNGEIVLRWALAGSGIILRSLWDVKPMLDSGELVQVLSVYSQSANVWAVYPPINARFPSCLRPQRACSRLEPQPKFGPTTRKFAPSQAGWFKTNCGSGAPDSRNRRSKKTPLSRPARSMPLRNCLGMITSVSMFDARRGAAFPVTISNGCMAYASSDQTNVGQATTDCGRSDHRRTHQMRASGRALTPLEIAVGAGGATIAWSELAHQLPRPCCRWSSALRHSTRRWPVR